MREITTEEMLHFIGEKTYGIKHNVAYSIDSKDGYHSVKRVGNSYVLSVMTSDPKGLFNSSPLYWGLRGSLSSFYLAGFPPFTLHGVIKNLDLHHEDKFKEYGWFDWTKILVNQKGMLAHLYFEPIEEPDMYEVIYRVPLKIEETPL